MGELVIQSPEKIESKIVGTVIKHLIHGISTPSLTHLLSLCGVSLLSFSILPNKKNPRSAGREIQMKPEFLSTLHQATQREIPSTSSQIGRTFQAHHKNVCALSKIPEMYRLLPEIGNCVDQKLRKKQRHQIDFTLSHCSEKGAKRRVNDY